MDTDRLPKVELHCHLAEGVVDPTMLRELRAQGHDLPVSAEALAATYPVRTVADWEAWQRVAAKPLEGSLTWFAPIAAAHVERLRAQRVEYAEIMLSPSEVPWDTPDTGLAVERVGAFRRRLDDVERRGATATGSAENRATHVELLMTLNRRRPLAALAAQARTAVALYDAGLTVGVALAGPEVGHAVQPLRHVLDRLHETGQRRHRWLRPRPGPPDRPRP